MEPGVYIVGTPIGNLGDLGLRALETLRGAEVILAEDTRHTARLLARYEVRATLVSCHRFNEASRVRLVLDRVRGGARVVLVTNAGMPAVSDPGARMVRACRREGIPVRVVPGPSAATAAVAASGFGGGGFHFEGFLPRKPGARGRRLEELAAEPCPVVLFESPYRAGALMEELAGVLGTREVFVGRELTKLNEECLWGTAAELGAEFARRAEGRGARPLKGEIVVVWAPAA
jgi:16S rRNA (cytidine1402-2'-O)-methyltransferase